MFGSDWRQAEEFARIREVLGQTQRQSHFIQKRKLNLIAFNKLIRFICIKLN